VRVSVGYGWETCFRKLTTKRVSSIVKRDSCSTEFTQPTAYTYVTDGFTCVDIRQYYLPYGLDENNQRPSKRGTSLRLDEWRHMFKLIPVIEAGNITIAQTKPCYDNDDYLGQLKFMSYWGCNPFSCNAWHWPMTLLLMYKSIFGYWLLCLHTCLFVVRNKKKTFRKTNTIFTFVVLLQYTQRTNIVA